MKLKALIFAILASALLSAQNSVILAPQAPFLSFTQTGEPNAFGCVFTYNSGTTSPLDTFTDYTGITKNTNPIILSGGGAANIWLTPGTSYRYLIKASGGSNCSSGTTIATVDGIAGGTSTTTVVIPYSPTPSFVITAQAELFQITLTGDAAALPITAVGIQPPAYITFQITQDVVGGHSFIWPANSVGGAPIGMAANQVTVQEFVWNGVNALALGPAVTGNGPALSAGQISAAEVDATGLNLNSTQLLSTTQQSGTGSLCMTVNCQLTTPQIVTPTINTAVVSNSPGAYAVIANDTSTGTTLNTLTKLTAAPAGIIAATTDTSGIIGIATANVGTTGNATIQQSGVGFCVFDGATTASDYVTISSSVAGNCTDAGASAPSASQNIGRVLSTNASGGTYNVMLYGPDIQTNATTVSIANAASTGTTLRKLAKLVGVPSKVVTPATTDMRGVVGITIANAGTTGTASVQTNGISSCVFDGATTAGDYVQISNSAAGDCSDSGANWPTSGQVVGRVLSTNVAGGTYSMLLFSGGIQGAYAIESFINNSCGSGCTINFAHSFLATPACQATGNNGSVNIVPTFPTTSQVQINSTVSTVYVTCFGQQ